MEQKNRIHIMRNLSTFQRNFGCRGHPIHILKAIVGKIGKNIEILSTLNNLNRWVTR